MSLGGGSMKAGPRLWVKSGSGSYPKLSTPDGCPTQQDIPATSAVGVITVGLFRTKDHRRYCSPTGACLWSFITSHPQFDSATGIGGLGGEDGLVPCGSGS